jgi:hypothetical protein
VVADAQGRFVRGGLMVGQCPDAPQALPLLDGLAPAYFIADRGYDSDSLVSALAARGTCAVIPPRGKRRTPRAYDAARYAQRHPVELRWSSKNRQCAVLPATARARPTPAVRRATNAKKSTSAWKAACVRQVAAGIPLPPPR